MFVFRNPLPQFLLGIPSIHSLPEASGSWERQYAPPALQWLHHAHPFVAATEKKVPHAEKQSVWSRSYGFKICYNPVIVLSVVLWDCCKPTNNCRDWAFSNSGLEVGLPAFQLPMFPECDAVPKGDFFDMLVFRNPLPPFLLGIPSIHSLPEASGSSLHYGCIMPIPQLQLQKRMSGVDPKMWALLGSQGAKSDSVSIKWFILAPHVTSRLSQIVWYWHRYR